MKKILTLFVLVSITVFISAQPRTTQFGRSTAMTGATIIDSLNGKDLGTVCLDSIKTLDADSTIDIPSTETLSVAQIKCTNPVYGLVLYYKDDHNYSMMLRPSDQRIYATYYSGLGGVASLYLPQSGTPAFYPRLNISKDGSSDPDSVVIDSTGIKGYGVAVTACFDTIRPVTGGTIVLGDPGLTICDSLNIYGAFNSAVDAEASDAYVITMTGITAYAERMIIFFDANTANTGACTININSLGAKALKSLHDQDPPDNYIEAGSIVMAVYDGTNFQMIQPDANP